MVEPNATAALTRGMQRAVLAVLLIVLISMLPTLLTSASRYHSFPLELAAYAALLLAAAIGAGHVLADHPLDGGRRWIPLAAAVVAALAASVAVPAEDLLSPAHWSWRVVGWFAVLLFLDRPIQVTLSVLATLLLPVLAQLALVGRLDTASLVRLAIIGTLNTGAQVVVAIGGHVVRRVGDSADRMAACEAELRTASLIADRVLADHEARYADIAATTVPLLEGLRDGRLRPGDPATRLQCSIEAARLRRLMAEGDDAVDPLVHELRACVDLAERAGLRVDVAVRGGGAQPGPVVRRLLTEPVITTLARARSQARLTVVATARDVVVSLVADVDPGTETPPKEPSFSATGAESEVDLSVVRLADRVWVTAKWTAS